MFLLALIFGILGASLALVVELTVLNLGGSFSYSTALPNFAHLGTLALAAIIEESARYLLLRQYVRRFLSDSPFSWQRVSSVGFLFGSGFASIELVLLTARESAPFLPTLGISLVHIILSTFFAFSLTRKLPFPALWVLACGIVLHFVYNLLLTL
ncbi:MAG: hypothetical protein Q8O53_02820 [Candidatus Moranbacteria bacterium]|nr:hypothetical protein [Candidatus Moranbacteria bacterium]